jgi:NAD-dependent dihydropyrimidine dehydrogenase PreA subunit
MAYQPQEIFFRSNAPVTVDEDKCIADKGCTVCVDVCPMDLLAINPATQKAYMAFDECWYCMPCEKDCPTGAVKVDIPYLLRWNDRSAKHGSTSAPRKVGAAGS